MSCRLIIGRLLCDMKKKIYYLLFALPILSLLFYSQVKSQTKSAEESFYTVKKQTLKDELSMSGTIDADEKVTLRFQTSGRLSWVGVKTGDYVKKYQAIASLDVRDVKAALQKKLNTFMKTRWDLDQQREDYEDKAITDAMKRVLSAAQYDLNSSIIDVELQDLAMEYASLITPIEGIVTEIGSPYAGVNITAAQAEFTVINPKTIYFSLKAEQTDVTNLKKGMKAEIILDAYPDKTMEGEIADISFSPIAGETTTTYIVKVKMSESNSDFKYRVGMTGDATFVLSQKPNIISIPTTMIKTERDKKYVFKLDNNKKVKTYIKTGDELNGDTEVLSGLKNGDVIY